MRGTRMDREGLNDPILHPCRHPETHALISAGVIQAFMLVLPWLCYHRLIKHPRRHDERVDETRCPRNGRRSRYSPTLSFPRHPVVECARLPRAVWWRRRISAGACPFSPSWKGKGGTSGARIFLCSRGRGHL